MSSVPPMVVPSNRAACAPIMALQQIASRDELLMKASAGPCFLLFVPGNASCI